MTRAFLILLLFVSGCAPRYKLVRIEYVGPVQAEIWKDEKLNQCERRVYLDSYYFRGIVPCKP